MVEQVCNAFIWSLDKQKGSKPRVAWKYVCMPRVFGGLNICNIPVWNDVALLKSLWALAYKKDRLWIRWVHDYYIKGADLLHYLIPSSASWMLARIIDSRRHVSGWHELQQWGVTGKFNIKEAYLAKLPTCPKPTWRSLWCNNKASPKSVLCLWQILQNRLPTKDRLLRWGITCDSVCVLCQQEAEDRDHLFGVCRFILMLLLFSPFLGLYLLLVLFN